MSPKSSTPGLAQNTYPSYFFNDQLSIWYVIWWQGYDWFWENKLRGNKLVVDKLTFSEKAKKIHTHSTGMMLNNSTRKETYIVTENSWWDQGA